MKKLFIGLLIAAVGAATFFYLQKKDNSAGKDFNKKWIIGQWTMHSFQTGKDSVAGLMVGIMGTVDTNLQMYNYEFKRNGTILQLIKDSVTADSSVYEWTENKQLIWKEDQKDTVGTTFAILNFSKDSLLISDKDSAQYLFIRVK